MEADFTISIIGLGLMGGSLAGAWRGKVKRVTGYDPDPEAGRLALRRRLVDGMAPDLASAVADARLVVLAAPVPAILDLLDRLGMMMKPGTWVMDLGSTKRVILERMKRLPAGIHPLGGHPMCGRETGGTAAADPALLQDAPFVLTPLPRTPARVIQAVARLVRLTGARPLQAGAGRHDRAAALISHLPYLVAGALVKTAARAVRQDSLTARLAASGFRDTTRLASSGAEMMTGILDTNRDEVLAALTLFRRELRRLERKLRDGSPAELARELETIGKNRQALLAKPLPASCRNGSEP